MLMEKIAFTLEGVCPIKFNRWHDLPQPRTDEGYREQAKEKCHRDKNGNLGIPAMAIKSSMKLASKEVGKKMDCKKNAQTIAAQVFISPIILSMGKKNYDGIAVDVISRGTGAKQTAVKTYRPIVNEWSVSGTMKLMLDVDQKLVKESLDKAGYRFGLLSHRPDFGRFVVTKWEVVK